MSDSDAPPAREDTDSVPPEGSAKGRRRRLEGVIPEIVRRAVEMGVERAQEAPDDLRELVKGLKVPKEVAHYLLEQVDDTKNGLFRVVAKEIRDFLEQTNFAGEMQKLLTTVQFEVNTTIRFSPNDGPKKKKSNPPPGEGAPETGDESQQESSSLPKPEVKTSVHVRKDRDRDT